MGRELPRPLNFSWIRKAQRCIDRVYSGCDDTRTKSSRHQKSMVKVPRLLAILVVGWILANGASASDDLAATQPIASQDQSTGTQTTQVQAGSSDLGTESQQVLDRRDRIFYPGDTERPKPLLRKLFLNIVLDQEEIFTSPLHINRHNALEWLVPMAVTGGLIASDTHIANAFENSRGQVRWGGRVSKIGASYTLIPIVAGSYVYGAWRDNKQVFVSQSIR